MAVAGLWLLATGWDRLWLHWDGRVPSWDQADYLNSAVDHGRALGLLPAGGWPGWAGLLDLSPKIPPLASLVNGSVMAFSGDAPDQALWAQSLWHGLLLLVVAAWSRALAGRRFALLATALVALAPGLIDLRVSYSLDIPLSATTTLALWLLGHWQRPAPAGGRWLHALAAALAISLALLVKQSALLVVALPALWSAGQGLRRRRRLQVLVALAVVLALLLPWLHHNWITTLGGTNRAVIESAAAEGDPAVLSLDSLLWYVRRLPTSLGWPLLLPGLLGGALALGRGRQPLSRLRRLPAGWPWLLGCTLAGLAATTLSPNKDDRYIAPVLPLLVLLLAAGWWQLGTVFARLRGRRTSVLLLGAGLTAAAANGLSAAMAALAPHQPNPLPPLIGQLRRSTAGQATTLMVLPGHASLNEHNVTTYGRLQGGRIVGRRLGVRSREHDAVLRRSSWLLLATGDQGTNRSGSLRLSLRVRGDGRFRRVGSWPWSEGRRVELWQRRGSAATFDQEFIALARGLEQGPRGVAALFRRIGIEHQLDGHLLYQQRVHHWARQRLQADRHDRDALWSLALLATLNNRPGEANRWYSVLEQLETGNRWPSAYRSVVLLADWNGCGAAGVADGALAGSEDRAEQPVLRALRDLGGSLCLDPAATLRLRGSLPEAIDLVKGELDRR
ncbi:MAG: phospholipid carrier-dependent glycosyltransferase [Cyanobium sp.]